MTPEAQNNAIAKACGQDDRWYIRKRDMFYRPNGSGYTRNPQEAWIVTEAEADKHVYPYHEPVTKLKAPVLRYTECLNAMHGAEKVLTPQQWVSYWSFLEPLACRPNNTSILHSTAAQRAEAFLRTLNLWKD
jgi:hypothetical protein